MVKFTLQRMFVSTSLMALGLGLYMVPIWTGCAYAQKGGPPLSEPVQWALCLGGAAAFGAGIGNIFHRPLVGAVAGPAILFAVAVVWSMH